MKNELVYQLAKPQVALAQMVESFWMLKTEAGADKTIMVLPDGRIDVLFSYSATQPFHVTLMGLGSEAGPTTLAAGMVIYAVSLRPLAVEYLLHTSVADILNSARRLPSGFWGITPADLMSFEQFCAKVSIHLLSLLPATIDPRKQRLFESLTFTNGTLPVRELAAKAGWSSRQINRYFQQYLGISLKTYCAILRFRASFPQLKAGHLFPELPFADQAHFIREVRKFAGVRPKELARNTDDRFIQFSAWFAE